MDRKDSSDECCSGGEHGLSAKGAGRSVGNGAANPSVMPKFFVATMSSQVESAACCPSGGEEAVSGCCASSGHSKRSEKARPDLRDHWNRVYEQSPIERLGWFEENPTLTLELLGHCALRSEDHILDAGSGASLLIDRLVERGFRRITAVDISENALDLILDRIGSAGSGIIRTLRRNLAVPGILSDLDPVDLWHDRAVLHFFTDEEDRGAYLENLKSVLRPGGHAILSVFSPEGAETCSGLPVRRYSAADLKTFLGEEFTLKESCDYLYHMPSGEPRPYVYTLFQRAASS